MGGRSVILVVLITAFVAAGAGILGLADWAGPTVDVSRAQAPDEKVHQQVLEALQTQPWVDVIVALREPPAARRAPLHLSDLQGQVAAEQEDVLSGLTAADFQVLRRYDSIPALFGRVSAAGLEKLVAHPDVTSVHPNLRLHATLSQSVPMINADDVHAMGHTGEGVTVAVLDTGIDTDHPDLQDDLLDEHCYLSAPDVCPCGGTSSHGPGCAEDGNGHGSHVSGIVTSGGVVAPEGVAPDTGIIAFKVLNDSGSGWFSDVLAALDYIIGHPGDGADFINMSLTGGPWTTPCDDAWPEMTTALDTLRSAGVSTFVATGNDADKSHLGFPSCISSAVSVGDVYDANNLGAMIWSACTDWSTWADMVVCHSNSHDTLDLLAPGALITSSVNGGGTANNWGGTSMAAPHAAAVAALMLDANPSATPDEIESCMKSSGVPVTDSANSVTTPRVDALGAVNCNGTPTLTIELFTSDLEPLPPLVSPLETGVAALALNQQQNPVTGLTVCCSVEPDLSPFTLPSDCDTTGANGIAEFTLAPTGTDGTEETTLRCCADGYPNVCATQTFSLCPYPNDTDCDGCSDAEELGSNPALGGTRDPNNPWDFYDVPVPSAFDGGTLGDRDQAVSMLNDVLSVLEYSGTWNGGLCNSGPDQIPGSPDGRCYNQDNNCDGRNDGLLYDRSAGATWSDAPNGAIKVTEDLLLVIAQTGHSCQAPP